LAGRFPPEAVQFLRNHEAQPLAEDEELVWGGGTMAGVMVMPDNAPLPLKVPAVSFSSFVLSIKRTYVEEYYQPLITPFPPEQPFAFIAGVSSNHHSALIAPPEMLLRSDVPVWRVRFTDWHLGPYGSVYWKRVITAEPLGD